MPASPGLPWQFLQSFNTTLVFQCLYRTSDRCTELSWLSCHSPVSVHDCSDGSCRSEVPENGGHTLPDGLLCWAPALWCHRLCHPSLAVAAAHRHPANLLPPALLLVNQLSLYLCPWPQTQLPLPPKAWSWGRFGTAFQLRVPLSAKRSYTAKRRGKQDPSATEASLRLSLCAAPDFCLKERPLCKRLEESGLISYVIFIKHFLNIKEKCLDII